MGALIDKLCKKRNQKHLLIDTNHENLEVQNSDVQQFLLENSQFQQQHSQQFISLQQFNQPNYDYKSILSKLATTLVSFQSQSKNTKLQNSSMARINKEIKLMNRILPMNQTNSIFVSVNENNMLQMEALIFGSEGTPYQNGAFLYKLELPDTYPAAPPTVDLLTTGNGKIRFNPNLYETGYVCLSLLGTWSGTGGQNWQPQKSNIAQILISIQTLVMNEMIFFNEPSYQDLDTNEFERNNRAYQNIVKYGNIMYAIKEALQNPPKRFKKIIKTHFYIKRNKIINMINKWIEESQLPCLYTDLTQSHNYELSKKYTLFGNAYRNDLIRNRKKIYDLLSNIKIEDTIICPQANESHKQKVQ